MGATMTDVALRLSGVTVRRHDRSVIEDASLTVGPGEILALMGESGSGKTTLLRVVAGLDPFHAGEIEVGGTRLVPREHGPSVAERRALGHRVGMVFQFHNLFDNLSALENVMLAPVQVHGQSKSDAERRARVWLDALGVGHRATARPRELSGGEAQRVAIARALAVEPAVLLMDEPTASLDAARRTDLAGLLTSLVAPDRTLVIATHDAAFARLCATRVVHVIDGRLVADSQITP